MGRRRRRRKAVGLAGILDLASHMPVLLRVLRELRPSSILEVGAGWYSTPLLQAYALASGAEHCVLEAHEGYRTIISQLYGCQVDLFDGNTLPEAMQRDWDLAFIDHRPLAARKEIACVLQELAGVIVLHDSDSERDVMWRGESGFGYSTIIDKWKHHKHFNEVKPPTLMLTNSDDVWHAMGS